MTKEQEIQHINSLIHSLGSHSYIGPWLQSVVASVEQDLRNDIIPTITPSECAKICNEKIEAANREAVATIKKAERDAIAIKRRAISGVRGLLSGIGANLLAAKNEVEARVYRLNEEEESLS